MDKQEIDNLVAEIMINDGPDGHCDGHEIITAFVIAVKEGREYEWREKYNAGKINRSNTLN